MELTPFFDSETAFGMFMRPSSISVVTLDLFVGAVEAMQFGVTKDMLLSHVELWSQQNARSGTQNSGPNGSTSHP